jgi:hypothetical protein
VKVLGRVFRGKFLAGLKRLHRRQQLRCRGPAEPKQFRRLLRRVHRQDWVVYAKPAFGGPAKVLRYLGRYTHRIAISNHRLVAFDGEHVTFRWKDYAHGGKQRRMTLLATEFLRRFFLHVLPKGFVRIRYFGFLANRFRARYLPLCQRLLASGRPPLSTSSQTPSTWHCPNCGAAMIVIRRLTTVELSRCAYFDTDCGPQKSHAALSSLPFQPIIVMQSAKHWLRSDAATSGKLMPRIAGHDTRQNGLGSSRA